MTRTYTIQRRMQPSLEIFFVGAGSHCAGRTRATLIWAGVGAGMRGWAIVRALVDCAGHRLRGWTSDIAQGRVTQPPVVTCQGCITKP